MITVIIKGPLFLLPPCLSSSWLSSSRYHLWAQSVSYIWLPCFYTMNLRCIHPFFLYYATVTIKIVVLCGLQKQGYFSLTLHVEYWLAVFCSPYSLESRRKKTHKQKTSILYTAVPMAEGKKQCSTHVMALKASSQKTEYQATCTSVATASYWMSGGWGSISLLQAGSLAQGALAGRRVGGWWTMMHFTSNLATCSTTLSPLAPRTPMPGVQALAGW